MLKKDLVIGIVGATILVAAMVGVFRYEAARTAGDAFEVEWLDETLAGPGATGRTSEGAESPVTLDIERENLTRVAFVLSWTDDMANSAGEKFELVVTSPDGAEMRQTSEGGKVEVVFEDLAAKPAPQTVLASGESDAHAKLESQSSRAGIGEWSVVVRLLDAGDLIVGGVAVQEDTGNAWTLDTQLTAYTADLTPR